MRPRSDRSGFVNFELGEARLTVAVHGEVSGPARDPLRIMVNLSVDELDEMHQPADGQGRSLSAAPGAGELGRAGRHLHRSRRERRPALRAARQLFRWGLVHQREALVEQRPAQRTGLTGSHRDGQHTAAAMRRRAEVEGLAHQPGSWPTPYQLRRARRARRGARPRPVRPAVPSGVAHPGPARGVGAPTLRFFAGEIQGPAAERC